MEFGSDENEDEEGAEDTKTKGFERKYDADD